MNTEIFKFPKNYIYMIIPIIILAILLLGMKKKNKILVELKIFKLKSLEIIRIIGMLIGVILICFSLLGPQSFAGTEKINRSRLDIYILIDTSKSMLVEDIVPNRLERGKQIINNIIENINGDRIGFIPFSSSAYIQMPLTDDYDLAKMFLEVIDTDMIGGGGSNVGNAITLAHESFARTTVGDKVILIISDGEENNINSIKALEKIDDNRLKVYSIGIGTKEGGLIPIYDETESKIIDYKKDKNGNYVNSKLNESTLKDLASIGNGKYYYSTFEGKEIEAFLTDISLLKRNENLSEEIYNYKQLYQYFLGSGILIFLISYFLPIRRQNI